MKLLLATLFLNLICLSTPVALAQWELNDLSILMPLPEPGRENLLWSTTSPSGMSALLPRKVYDRLPMLVVMRDRQWLFDSLRLLAMRIDPCFREGDGPCQKQVRFVWQPMEQIAGTWTTLDAAVHTFHALDDNQWQTLLEGMKQIKAAYSLPPNLPLGVHPVLKTQGMSGAFAKSLASLVFQVCKKENLIRATAMTVNIEGSVWVFVGYNIKGDEMVAIPVPRTDNLAQAFFTNPAITDEYRSRMNPEPKGESAFLKLLTDSKLSHLEMPEGEMVSAIRSSYFFSNPRLSNPGTVDCASCHSARAVPAWAGEKFPSWDRDWMFGPELFRGPGNLADTTVNSRRTNILRAFGYFGRDPVVAPRTANETSLVIELLNR